MKFECDRCQEFDCEIVTLFSVYHARLCLSCRNDFEPWLRTQEFWKQEIDLEAVRLFLTLPSTSLHQSLEHVQDLIVKCDTNRLAAFPLIQAWIKAGKAKEE